MANTSPRLVARLKRKKRIRKNIFGNQERPRLSVFRTAKHIYAQIIDDTKGITLVAASTLDKEYKDTPVDGKKQDVAKSVGQPYRQKGQWIKELKRLFLTGMDSFFTDA